VQETPASLSKGTGALLSLILAPQSKGPLVENR
jgi:hypothetical protein